MRIVFVCQGNIIRSPLAENMLRDMLRTRGLENRFNLDSAGTSAYHVGEPPDSRMRQVARSKGFKYTGRARQFHPEDFKNFDLIIALDRANRRTLESWAGSEEDREKIRLLREFDPQGGEGEDVPDPYYGGREGFEITYQIVERSCQGLADFLERGESPI